MSKSESNRLSQYLQRVMKRKELSLAEVERRCNRKITNSYVSRILSGEVTNLTVETIEALSEGLGEDPYKVFAAAHGKPPRDEGRRTAEIDPAALAEAIEKLVAQPELIDVVEKWSRLAPKQRSSLMEPLNFFSEQNARQVRSRVSDRRKR
jgi:transcriptional regulator with XRE-family HTH domain